MPLAYASGALSKTEEKYSQIEKEMLAVTFALEKFHDFVYGRHVVVYTGHRPLVSIVKKSMSDISPRLQRFQLRLLKYNFELLYQQGSKMYVADTLSRAYLLEEIPDESYQMLAIHSCSNVVASKEKLEQLLESTKNDTELCQLTNYISSGWPRKSNRLTSNMRKYKTFSHQLSCNNELLFFENRLIIPSSMQKEVLHRLHETHLNIQKTKRLARNTVFWLGMSRDIDNFLSKCEVCNKYKRNNPPEKLKPFNITTRPWQRVSSDILTHNSSDYLLIYDSYSYWIELITLKTKTAVEIIQVMQSVFSKYGVPEEIVSDNMPYNSAPYQEFAKDWGFQPVFTSPRYPQANGFAEKGVSITKNMLRKNEDIYYALLQYRNAPIPHVGYSPAQLMMGRSLKTKLTVDASTLEPSTPNREIVLQKKAAHSSKQEYYYNRQATDLPPVQPNDKVYFKMDLHDKEWLKGKVVKEAEGPRSYLIQDENSSRQLIRNRRFIRRPARYNS